MKKIFLLLAAACVTLSAAADEGMWLPSLIGSRIKDMRSKGFRLTAEDIYSINRASMKDAVVLFDEIEKAHEDVWNLLLQILEDGMLTDAQGRRVDFRNTVLVMTSNVGAKAITSSAAKLGFAQAEDGDGGFARVKETVMAELRATFKPEFLNRIDSTVVFRRLSRADVSAIARRMLEATVQRAAALGVTLTVEDAAVERIADEGFDPLYGARPLRRVIRAEVEDAVAELLLSGTLHAGGAARIAAEDGALRVRREEPSIPAAAET